MRSDQNDGKVIAKAQVMLLCARLFSYASTLWKIDVLRTSEAILKVLVLCLVKYVPLDDAVVCIILSKKH
jgi:hypothetical protein